MSTEPSNVREPSLINAPEAELRAFAALWSEQTGQETKLVRHLRAYELRSVI
jgi:hypothetical protein